MCRLTGVIKAKSSDVLHARKGMTISVLYVLLQNNNICFTFRLVLKMPPRRAGVGMDYHRPFVCLCLLWVNVCEAQQSISKLRRGPSEWFLLCLCAPVSCDVRPRQGEGLFVYCGCPAVSICPHLLSRFHPRTSLKVSKALLSQNGSGVTVCRPDFAYL